MKVAIIGFGFMGQKIAQIFAETGVSVAAVVDPAPDLAERIKNCFSDADDTPDGFPSLPNMAALGVDVVVHSFATKLADIKDVALECAKAKLHVISIAEDAFDPFFNDEDLGLAAELDTAFLDANATFLSTGVQDNFLYRIPLALVEANSGITKLKISNTADLAILGRAVFDHMPIGGSKEAAVKFVEEGVHGRVCFDVAIRPMIRRLGREICSVKNQLRLVIAEQDIPVEQHNLLIKANQVCGVEEFTTVVLDNQCCLELSLVFRFPTPGSQVNFRYEIEGKSPSVLHVEPFDGAMATCAAVVSRALSLKNPVRRGFVSVDQLI